MESSNHPDRRKSGILKKSGSGGIEPEQLALHHHNSNEHVHFDEAVIKVHDEDRGTRMKIDEPKTPYTEDMMEEDLGAGTGGSGGTSSSQDVHMHASHPVKHVLTAEEEEIKRHLEEAERNKLLNAQLQKEQALIKQQFHQELTEKLDSTQTAQQEEEKHQQFLKMRKEHYKNEIKAAQLLKQQVPLDEDDDEEGGSQDQKQ